MNARQKKKRRKKWAIANDLEEKLYCDNCGKKLDIKRNKYAIKWGTCNSYCYGACIGYYW